MCIGSVCKQEAHATAIWNGESWDVHITTIETIVENEEITAIQTATSHSRVELCDEIVIPGALSFHNGWSLVEEGITEIIPAEHNFYYSKKE